MSSSSSRTREWKDSTYGFCHGEPGSMYTVPVLESSHKPRSAWAVISGPLSIRRCSGAPRSATSRSSVATTMSASMPRATSITSDSRVNSSTMLSSFSARPSAVWSN